MKTFTYDSNAAAIRELIRDANGNLRSAMAILNQNATYPNDIMAAKGRIANALECLAMTETKVL